MVIYFLTVHAQGDKNARGMHRAFKEAESVNNGPDYRRLIMLQEKITRREFLKITGTSALVGAALPGCSSVLVESSGPQEFDILIKNGFIVDGTGGGFYRVVGDYRR